MGRFLLGLVLAVVLIFPGVEALRWLAVDVTGAYDDMTLTEAFLGMIVVLLSVLAVRGLRLQLGRESGPDPGMTGGRVVLRPQRLGGRVPQRRPVVREDRRSRSRPRTRATERREAEAPEARRTRRPARTSSRDRRRDRDRS